MHIADYERFTLGAALYDKGAARLLIGEVMDSAFHYGPDNKPSSVHRTIFQAIQESLMDNKVPDIPTVAAQMGTNVLASVGGRAYLTALVESLSKAGIYSTEGLPQWATIVDRCGRIRQMQTVLKSRVGILDALEDGVLPDINPDVFLADTLEMLNGANVVQLEYSPIAEAVARAREQLRMVAEGTAVTWLPVGWPSLNQFKLLPYRSLFVLLGISSMGKSALLAQFLLGAAIQLKRFDLPGVVVLNTYEMGADQYIQRMASCLSGVNLLSPEVEDIHSSEYAKLQDALDFIELLPICTNEGSMTSWQIINQTALLGVQRGGVRVVGIDYAELVPDRNKESEERRVTQIFRNAFRLSRTGSEPAVIMVSQFNNEVNQDDTKLGDVRMIRYSRAGRQAADMVGIIYNPPQMRENGTTFRLNPRFPDGDHAYLLIGKNRHGKVGWVALDWDAGCTRFSDTVLSGFGGELYEGLNEVQSMGEGAW